MKTLRFIVLLTLVSPSISFGQLVNYCYKATAPVPEFVPTEFCLSRIYESGIDNTLEIESYHGSMPSKVLMTQFSRHTEERFAFVSETEILRNWEMNCSYGVIATLNIKGQSLMQTIYPDRLDISVSYRESRDTCHHEPMAIIVPYTLVK